ncbi:hypothetical protein T07_6406 [Trichinella nelsoni]|uniref:Uncharacterized protein n=1 Tax=Trichinella nelsoni TaxID=6336 RepID=A0A0V0SH56_9BILA|nr:hypothetical protein T07_6406 [Trichinella nelsoni]
MCRLIYWASSPASVRVALQSNIAKIYLQVGLHERDHDVCRFLWRRDEVGSSPSMYRFTWVFWFGLPSLLGHGRCKISPGSTSGLFSHHVVRPRFPPIFLIGSTLIGCSTILLIGFSTIHSHDCHIALSQAWEVPDNEEKILRILHKSLVFALYRHLTIKCDHSANNVEPSAVEPQKGKRRAAQSTSTKSVPTVTTVPVPPYTGHSNSTNV